MSAGQNTDMLKGAIAACLLPMTLGALGSFYIIASRTRGGLEFMTMPIALCFLFGTPVAAWLACRRLKKIENPKILSLWRKSASSGVLAALSVHFITATCYSLYVAIMSSNISGTGATYAAFSETLLVSLIINIGLFTILTLPFALICATIFWAVTKFAQAGSSPDLWE